MKKGIRWLGGALFLFVSLLAAVFAWDFEVQKNFDTVVPGKMYRSGQPREGQLEAWIQEYGLKSILSLRHGIPSYEEELAERHGVPLYHVPFSASKGLREGQWEEIRSILTEETNLPVLVHCRGGGDRSGIVTALYRVEIQGWPLDKAIWEMNLHYHVPLKYPVLQRQLREYFQEVPEGIAPQEAG
jgi:protein tyrosine/serine phosphatase